MPVVLESSLPLIMEAALSPLGLRGIRLC